MARHRIGGWAAVTAAAWSALLATAFYVFIHGSTGRDRNGSFLGWRLAGRALSPGPRCCSSSGVCIRWYGRAPAHAAAR